METGTAMDTGRAVSQIEAEVVGLFVRLVDLLGLPRSIGEIYGMLFVSERPLCMDDLIEKLHLSKGSVSQGLRQLRAFGAVRTVYINGERRDHFVAEDELRKLARGFLKEQVQPHLDSGEERLNRIHDQLKEKDGEEESAYLAGRVKRLDQWRARARRLLPVMIRMLDMG